MLEEQWKAVARDGDNISFDVLVLRNSKEKERRQEQLTLSELAAMLTQGGLPSSEDKLRQLKIVGGSFPLRFRKSFGGPGQFTIQMVQ